MGDVLNLTADLFPADANFKNFAEDFSDSDIESSGNVIGLVAEFLACAALAQLGVRVHHVPTSGYDLIADSLGKLHRVQVKGMVKPDRGRYHRRCVYEKSVNVVGLNVRKRVYLPLTVEHCDVVALVALDLRRVVFTSISAISEAGQLAVPVADFRHPDIERLSWLAATSVE